MIPRQTRTSPDGDTLYRCSKCKAFKGRPEFMASKINADGVSSHCKVCEAHRKRERRVPCPRINPTPRKRLPATAGLVGRHHLTLDQVGKIVGLTREAVRQTELRALEKIHAAMEQDDVLRTLAIDCGCNVEGR